MNLSHSHRTENSELLIFLL